MDTSTRRVSDMKYICIYTDKNEKEVTEDDKN